MSYLLKLFALISTFLILFNTTSVFAQEVDQNEKMSSTKHSIVTLQETAKSGIITTRQAEEGTNRYLTQLSQDLGRTVTLDEVMSAPDPQYLVQEQELTALQKAAGFITFINIIWVLAIIIGVLSFGYLFGHYVLIILALFTMIPLLVYEGLFYIISFAVIAGGLTFSPDTRSYVGFTGCLLFAAALAFSVGNSRINLKGSQLYLILALVWGVTALFYGSSMIGFIAIAALLAALGFMFIASPLCYVIGFEDEDAVGRATSAAFLILGVFVGLRIVGIVPQYVNVFEAGALYLGSFVGYLGLLIASHKWYTLKRYDYITFQILTITAGIAALFVGSVYNIGELQKIGGTFFVLYIVEKLMEIPARNTHQFALVGLVVSGFLFGLCMFVVNNQDMMRSYILMPL